MDAGPLPAKVSQMRRCSVKRLARLCSVVLILLTCPAFAATKSMTLVTSASESFTAYVAGPEDATRAIVLVHDWFGVSPFYTEAAERLASQGYRVVAVDLYGGRRATTHEEA